MDALLLILIGAAFVAALWILRRRVLGFQGQRPSDYDGSEPGFDIRQHLSGPMECEGVIFGPTGRVVSRFVADFEGTWDGNSGTISERFKYDSGSVQSREWQLDVSDDGRIRARADDVVGTGDGQQAGYGVVMKYDLRLPEAAGGHVLSVNDWMYMLENGAIMNRSQFRKFGIKVAELVATIRPKGTT